MKNWSDESIQWVLDITGLKQDKLSQKNNPFKTKLVGSMLNVTGVDEVTYVQKIAVEDRVWGFR